MSDISVIGFAATVKESNLFPNGFTLTQFADDTAPFDEPEVTLAETGMGANGHMVVWRSPAVKTVTIALIPGSEDAKNMQVCANAGQVGLGQTATAGRVSMSVVWPSGAVVNYSNGVVTAARLGVSAGTGGRVTTPTFTIAFESVTANL